MSFFELFFVYGKKTLINSPFLFNCILNSVSFVYYLTKKPLKFFFLIYFLLNNFFKFKLKKNFLLYFKNYKINKTSEKLYKFFIKHIGKTYVKHSN